MVLNIIWLHSLECQIHTKQTSQQAAYGGSICVDLFHVMKGGSICVDLFHVMKGGSICVDLFHVMKGGSICVDLFHVMKGDRFRATLSQHKMCAQNIQFFQDC